MSVKENGNGMEKALRKLRSLPANFEKAAVRTLCYIGEQAVNIAKDLPAPPEGVWKDADGTVKNPIPPHAPNYIDWTNNLRSSIGYVVVVNGEIVSKNFPTQEGKEGNSNGQAFAEELAANHDEGIALILVAGMHYAKYVQSKGYDVLNSAVMHVDEVAPKLLNELIEDMEAAYADQ